MNHPNREQWIAYLYAESPTEQRAELKTHADSCADCQAQLTSWSDAKSHLSKWSLPLRSNRPVLLRQTVKWGIAAMLMIGFGIGLARMTAPQFDSTRLEKNLRAEFQQQVAAVMTTNQSQVATLFAKMEQDRAVDYGELRADLETVAVTAEATLRRTQRQIGQLTLIAQNGNDSPKLNKN